MNQPWVYMYSPSWIPLPPPSPSHPSGSSQCKSPEHPVSCIEPGLAICFTYDNIYASVLFSQIIAPSPSPTESKRLFYTSVSLLLSPTQGYRYHLSKFHIYSFSSVQISCSLVSDSLWSHEPQHARPPCPSPTPGVHPNPCPLSRWCHPAISSSIVPFSSRLKSFSATDFSNESALRVKWPKYWSFRFNISLSNEHPGLISFRMDWLDLLAVQGILKSLLQHHSPKASILWGLAFFIVQLSHPHMTTGKTIALTRRTFVDKSNVSAFEYAV